jgi:hypothetical protein
MRIFYFIVFNFVSTSKILIISKDASLTNQPQYTTMEQATVKSFQFFSSLKSFNSREGLIIEGQTTQPLEMLKVLNSSNSQLTSTTQTLSTSNPKKPTSSLNPLTTQKTSTNGISNLTLSLIIVPIFAIIIAVVCIIIYLHKEENKKIKTFEEVKGRSSNMRKKLKDDANEKSFASFSKSNESRFGACSNNEIVTDEVDYDGVTFENIDYDKAFFD